MHRSKALISANPLNRFAIFLLPLLFTACFSYEEVELKSLDDVRLVGLSPTTLSLEISATINNPNDYKIKIKDPDIDIFIEGHKVGKLDLKEAFVLEKDIEQQYRIPIQTELDGALGSLFPILLTVMTSPTIRFAAKGSFKGSARMLSQRIDVDIDQQVDLSGR